jgi:hypothetical protein
MGRLTLNVLLSFAQFEREVIGERVRDKIAASKRTRRTTVREDTRAVVGSRIRPLHFGDHGDDAPLALEHRESNRPAKLSGPAVVKSLPVS